MPQFDITKHSWICKKKLKPTEMEKLLILAQYAGMIVEDCVLDFEDINDFHWYLGSTGGSRRKGLDRWPALSFAPKRVLTHSEVKKYFKVAIKQRKS